MFTLCKNILSVCLRHVDMTGVNIDILALVLQLDAALQAFGYITHGQGEVIIE